MVRSAVTVPGATAPKMRLVMALSGVCRACRAMTSPFGRNLRAIYLDAGRGGEPVR